MRDLFVDKPIDLYADEIKTFETSSDVRDFWKVIFSKIQTRMLLVVSPDFDFSS